MEIGSVYLLSVRTCQFTPGWTFPNSWKPWLSSVCSCEVRGYWIVSNSLISAGIWVIIWLCL